MREVVDDWVDGCRVDQPKFRGGLLERRSGAYLWQILSGIAYLHHHAFVHRDVKHTMAPEVMSGIYAQPADMWSIGVTAYYMCCGELPFGTSPNAEGYGKEREYAEKVMAGAH